MAASHFSGALRSKTAEDSLENSPDSDLSAAFGRPERHDRRTVTASSDIVGEHDIGIPMRFKNLMPRARDQRSQT